MHWSAESARSHAAPSSRRSAHSRAALQYSVSGRHSKLNIQESPPSEGQHPTPSVGSSRQTRPATHWSGSPLSSHASPSEARATQAPAAHRLSEPQSAEDVQAPTGRQRRSPPPVSSQSSPNGQTPSSRSSEHAAPLGSSGLQVASSAGTVANSSGAHCVPSSQFTFSAQDSPRATVSSEKPRPARLSRRRPRCGRGPEGSSLRAHRGGRDLRSLAASCVPTPASVTPRRSRPVSQGGPSGTHIASSPPLGDTQSPPATAPAQTRPDWQGSKASRGHASPTPGRGRQTAVSQKAHRHKPTRSRLGSSLRCQALSASRRPHCTVAQTGSPHSPGMRLQHR